MVDEPSSSETDEVDVDEFFVEQTDQSRVKTTIYTKYVFSWAKILIPRAPHGSVGVVDVYCGPGRYLDGMKSSPVVVLEHAIKDNAMRDGLVTVFNDAHPGHVESLRAAVDALPGVTSLRFPPRIITGDVRRLLPQLERPHIPTFAFIDPYGYKGLSLGLVNAIIKDWACECLFFFNYNRINPGINNPAVKKHMEALFGAMRLDALRAVIVGVSAPKREVLVMAALADALRALGGKYILPFRFRMADTDRTSHYLVFVSKNPLGYKIMRDVMAKASSYAIDGVPSFEHTPERPLFLPDGRSVEALADALASTFAGQTISVKQVFERHSVGKLYIEKNYKAAMIGLERQRRAFPSRGVDQRPKGTLADGIMIRFPPSPGVAASRSTADRRVTALPTSDVARPTA